MTDHIHGVTFTDYAATCAFQVQGKDISELVGTLGITLAQWPEIDAYWQKAMAEDEAFALATELGQVFQNPAVGKFAGAETQTASDVLSKVPDLEAFINVQAILSIGTQAGLEPEQALQTAGLSLIDYSQVSMHYMDQTTAMMDNPDKETADWFAETHQAARQKAAAQFGVDLEDEG